jgi:hypothetical protein
MSFSRAIRNTARNMATKLIRGGAVLAQLMSHEIVRGDGYFKYINITDVTVLK